MKNRNKTMTEFLTYSGVIAAIYVALTLLFEAISFGPIQFRIAELLCVLPYFTPAALPDADGGNWGDFGHRCAGNMSDICLGQK